MECVWSMFGEWCMCGVSPHWILCAETGLCLCWVSALYSVCGDLYVSVRCLPSGVCLVSIICLCVVVHCVVCVW